MTYTANMPKDVRIVLVFLDGVGVGTNNESRNPLTADVCPNLRQLLEESSTPIDARLGVPGLPQSATGQTALLTGVNAPSLVGRHVEGFPGPALQDTIRQHNIFRRLRALGLPTTFANAYFIDRPAELDAHPRHSVTTVAARSALGRVLTTQDLLHGHAVYHDLTREALLPRGFRGPVITPETAAEQLASIGARHRFTLFEYFQTDRVGHSGSMHRAREVLGILDRFVGRLLAQTNALGITLAITSDHGNIEDLSVTTHTANPVPFITVGHRADSIREGVQSLTGVAAALIQSLS